MVKYIIDENGMDALFSDKLRFLNLFLVLTIVSGHVSWYCNGEDWLTDVYRKSTMGTMGWFFFSSAFWYFKNYDMTVFVKKFISRLKTLLLPYLLFNLIAIMFNFERIVLQPVGFTQKMASILRCFAFCEREGVDILPLDNPTWYIIRLLTYFLVSPIGYFLFKNKCVGIISLISIFYFTLNGQYYWFNGFLFVFCLGAFVSMHYKDEFVKLLTKYTIRSNAFIGVFLFLLLYALISFLLIKVFAVYPPMMAMSTMIQFLVSAICISLTNVTKLDLKWGGYAFLVFCGHIIWLTPLKPIFDYIDGLLGFYNPGIRTAMMCISIVSGTVVCAKILDKVFPKFYMYITGNRG